MPSGQYPLVNIGRWPWDRRTMGRSAETRALTPVSCPAFGIATPVAVFTCTGAEFDRLGVAHSLDASVRIAQWAYSRAASAGGSTWQEGNVLVPLRPDWELGFPMV